MYIFYNKIFIGRKPFIETKIACSFIFKSSLEALPETIY